MEESLVKYISGFVNTDDVVKAKAQLQELTKKAEEYSIIDTTSKKNASDMMGILKKLQKGIDQKRKEFLEPYEQAKKFMKGQIDSIIEEANNAHSILEKKLMSYVKEEQIEAERLAKIEAEKIRQEMEAKVNELSEQQNLTEADMSDAINSAIATAGQQIEMTEKLKPTTKAKGYMFTTNIQTRWVAKVVDPEVFLTWIMKEPKTRLKYINTDTAFRQIELNSLADQVQKETIANGLQIIKEEKMVSR